MLRLSIAGNQVPTIPLFDCTGSIIISPSQIGAIVVNSGIVFGFTLTVNFAVVLHCPEFGVNVYSVVVELFIAGVHVPGIP
ncbi:hypothetical protein F2P46_35940, partial [Massilia sp. CCM 8734]|nr:hypothetical protein [Massilia sp. CCM 8734]